MLWSGRLDYVCTQITVRITCHIKGHVYFLANGCSFSGWFSIGVLFLLFGWMPRISFEIIRWRFFLHFVPLMTFAPGAHVFMMTMLTRSQ